MNECLSSLSYIEEHSLLMYRICQLWPLRIKRRGRGV